MTTDLERAYNALSGKLELYNRLWRYYDGDQPVVYTAQRLNEIFANIDARFNENWCSVVIDSVADRITLDGFTIADDESAQQQLSEAWEELELALEADDTHKAALVCGEAFLIVWPAEDGEIQAYYNDPRLCHVFYEAENPRRKRLACKWWIDNELKYRLTLYYPDRIEYYQSEHKAENVSSANSFEPFQPAQANPYEEIPVFHFRTERRTVKSDLTDAIPIQNAINKLLIDMMVAAEYGAFKQKWIISNADTPGKLKNAPNEIWDLPAGDGVSQNTQVGEFTATELSNYFNSIDKLSSALGAITRTPKHYLYQQGGDPSGEALIAMEAPLNKKVQDRIDRFTPVWRQVATFLMLLKGFAVESRKITPLFARPETVQPRTEAEIVQLETTSGIPLTTAVRRRGWTEAEIDQMNEDRTAEREMQPAAQDTTSERDALLAQRDAVVETTNATGADPAN